MEAGGGKLIIGLAMYYSNSIIHSECLQFFPLLQDEYKIEQKLINYNITPSGHHTELELNTICPDLAEKKNDSGFVPNKLINNTTTPIEDYGLTALVSATVIDKETSLYPFITYSLSRWINLLGKCLASNITQPSIKKCHLIN